VQNKMYQCSGAPGSTKPLPDTQQDTVIYLPQSTAAQDVQYPRTDCRASGAVRRFEKGSAHNITFINSKLIFTKISHGNNLYNSPEFCEILNFNILFFKK
jgi:hypothetical protein